MRLPGDKSIAIRAMLLASVARAPWRLSNLPTGDDVRHALRAVAASGARVARSGNAVQIEAGTLPATLKIDVGDSATLLRLASGLWSTHDVDATLEMDGALARRPHARFTATLAHLVGEDVVLVSGATVRVRGRPLRGAFDVTTLDDSAQQKSALLFAGLALEGSVTVRQVSRTRAHTEEILTALGARLRVRAGGREDEVELEGPFSPGALDAALPGDPSSAALLAVAVAAGGTARFDGVSASPLRLGFFTVLERMGARVGMEAARATQLGLLADVVVEGGALRGVEVTAAELPSLIDEVPALACVCALASGESRLLGLAPLRGKESDRARAVAELLTAFGVMVREDGDALVIAGRPRRFQAPAVIRAHGDHRIAMAALALARATGLMVEIDDASCIAKSFPEFSAALDVVAPPH